MNGVNGNGGGSSAGTAIAMAPDSLTVLFRRSNRARGTSRSTPTSPILRPIQNVTVAPASDPAVARSGYLQNSASSRAAR